VTKWRPGRKYFLAPPNRNLRAKKKPVLKLKSKKKLEKKNSIET